MQEENTNKPVVAVTGASRDIGHVIVRHFHNNGWDVVTLARTPFPEICPRADGIVQHIKVDLSQSASVITAAAELREILSGRGLNALVNNSGISPKRPEGQPIDAMQTSIKRSLMCNMLTSSPHCCCAKN
ncbi:SDR family NAD(P)-dependent oxidoreductase [Tateyamaria sp.]|uniref:SDR family NAD(P)-dependent oxidoreductase n=1 Tax=Tateyamaria sp. TaxID=1929288 RepID=UPI00329D9F6D